MEDRLDLQKLKDLMKEQGLVSISTLAVRSGVHRNTIRAYLQGNKSPYSSTFLAMANCLGVSPAALISNSTCEDAPVKKLLSLLEPAISANSDLAFILIGSRAQGKAREFSDIDLGITAGSEALDYKRFLSIKSRINDLVEDFSWLVDVVDLDAAPLWFLQGIDYQIHFLAGSISSFSFFKGVLDGVQKASEKSTAKSKRVRTQARRKAA